MKTTKKQIRDIIKEEIQNVLSEGNMKNLESDIVNGLMEMMQSLNIDLEMIKGVIDSGAVQDAMYMLGVDQPGTMME